MVHEIACRCGRIIPISESMAGSSQGCECGESIVVPPLSQLRAGANSNAAMPADAGIWQSDGPARPDRPPDEVIPPRRVSLRIVRGVGSGRRTTVMVALTPDGLWIQHPWRLQVLALHGLEIERLGPKELALTPAGDPPRERLILTLASAAEAQRLHYAIRAQRPDDTADPSHVDRRIPEGVTLVRTAPAVKYVELGPVGFTHRSGESADRAVQLRAGLRGADAVIDLQREKCPELGLGARRVSGLAVRVEDPVDRERLRRTWFVEEVSALARWMLLLVVIDASLIFLVAGFLPGKSPLVAATGETLAESLSSAGLGIALYFGWPLFLLILLWIFRRRELLRAAALSVLAFISIRGIVVVTSHLAAAIVAGVTPADAKLILVLDPLDWTFVVLGLVAFKRAWRLSRQSSQVLPEEDLTDSVPRKVWSRGLLATTVVFALVLVGWSAISRYEESRYLLQKGVDPQGEQQALLAIAQGADQTAKGDLAAAEKSFQRSLRLWEQMIAKGPVPSHYRANLAVTLSNLGLICMQQGREDEAEKYYGRAATIADRLRGDPDLDEETRQFLAQARETHDELRGATSARQLEQKDEAARRKYEEGLVSVEKDPRRAEDLYLEAIGLWEEVLPQATEQGYRKDSVSRLATAYIHVGELQSRLGRASEASASLKKAIAYGEQAVDLNPTRPLPRHNLEVARRLLETLHEQAFQEEIDKLGRANRFSEIIDAFTRSIGELEMQVRTGKEVDVAVPSLAHRSDRLAWYLAHCPVRRLRDTKAALEHAHRATKLRSDLADYWYTLAMVQYRNGDWRESLASIDVVKAKRGELQASDWLLSAMGLHRLGRRTEAREALDRATKWLQERKEKADHDPVIRIENETIWSSIEALLWEASNLLDEGESAGPKAA